MGAFWTTAEQRILAAGWSTVSKQALLDRLPGRTWLAICARATSKGYRRKRVTTMVRARDPLVQQLVDRRQALRKRQLDVATDAGISLTTLVDVENMRGVPNVGTLRAIAGALGLRLTVEEVAHHG